MTAGDGAWRHYRRIAAARIFIAFMPTTTMLILNKAAALFIFSMWLRIFHSFRLSDGAPDQASISRPSRVASSGVRRASMPKKRHGSYALTTKMALKT